MKKKKIKKYTGPKYPNKDLYTSHPELLFSYVPARWLKSKALIGALTAMTLGGIRIDAANQNTASPQLVQEKDQEKKATEETKKTISVAPIFIHGDGVGATGCVVISPPAFLSEAEAMDIILSEFKKAGIEFDEIGFHADGMDFKQSKTRRVIKWDKENKKTNTEFETIQEPYPLVFEAYNRKLNLGFKFVSRENYSNFIASEEGIWSSVTGYDFIAVAQDVRDSLQSYGKCSAAVFYDPLEDRRESMFESEKIEKPEIPSAELLHIQVRDFLKWMNSLKSLNE